MTTTYSLLHSDSLHGILEQVAENLSALPCRVFVLLATCNAGIREVDVSNGWWYKGCNVCKRGLKATFDGFECTNCDEAKPVVIPR
jgi:hypothetical protein